MSVVASGNRAPTTALLSHYCHSNPAAFTPYSPYHHFFFPSLTSKGVSCFPWFHKSPTAIGILFLPLLSDKDQLFYRTKAAWLSWHPAPHQSTIWRSKPKKNCISPKELLFNKIHMNSTPPVSTHTLGLNIQLLQWLGSAGVRTLGNTKRLVLRRLCLETGSRNHPVYLTIWTVPHTCQVSLFPLITPMEFHGNRLWPLE